MGNLGWIALGVALGPGMAQAGPSCEVRSGAQTTPLLELYTSEGCSSCPPADRWFSSLAGRTQPQPLNLLAFHVDYWDELGWHDRYSQHAFTLRQGQRVRAGGSSTVYTPQLMLSSHLGLRWSQAAEVEDAIRVEQALPARADLHLRARPQIDGWRVDLDGSGHPVAARGAQLYLAMYEDELVSQVAAGENAGALLHHDRVVRGLWGPWPMASRHLDVHPPAGANPKFLGLTAFVQNPAGFTLQSLSLSLQDCAVAQ